MVPKFYLLLFLILIVVLLLLLCQGVIKHDPFVAGVAAEDWTEGA